VIRKATVFIVFFPIDRVGNHLVFPQCHTVRGKETSIGTEIAYGIIRLESHQRSSCFDEHVFVVVQMTATTVSGNGRIDDLIARKASQISGTGSGWRCGALKGCRRP
jgi:hypothetical protein